MDVSISERDHIFISYAYEDSALAKWLALRLTSEGYRVWIDQFELLGGESYPRDIDIAIKQRTFRVLGLLSRSSLSKPNPVKERTLALNIARERKEDFLVPLNVDGLSPTELDWMTSDLTFISFCHSWAVGFDQLLRKLSKVNAPKGTRDGRTIAASQVMPHNVKSEYPEQLFSNLLLIKTVPAVVHRFRFNREPSPTEKEYLLTHWPFYYNQSDLSVRRCYALAFEDPPTEIPNDLRLFREGGAVWEDVKEIDGIPSWQIAKPLIRKTILLKLQAMGLIPSENGAYLFFPFGISAKNKIPYTNLQGRKTSVQVAGYRTFSGKDKFRYELGFTFDVIRLPTAILVAKVRIRLRLTNTEGTLLPSASALARRKSITRTWFNHEFGSRYLAIYTFLSPGQSEFSSGDKQHILIDTCPISMEVPFGINERILPKGRQMFRHIHEQEPPDQTSNLEEENV